MSRPRRARTPSRGKRARAIRTSVARVSARIGRGLRLFWAAPVAVRAAVAAAVLLAAWAATNWVVQTVRKPSEVLFPVGRALAKTPARTWREYGPLFREHSTPVVSPELLAALAQVEGAGNPVARPRWSWHLSW